MASLSYIMSWIDGNLESDLLAAGTQFSFLGEIFPRHLRAKGVCLGVAMISFMNIIWL